MTNVVTHYSQQHWTPQYAKLVAGMRGKELLGYLNYVVRPRNKAARHVLIYAQGRTGSTLLASLLASTGLFEDIGEPLHLYTREVWMPGRYLRGAGRGKKCNVVAHVKGSQLRRDRKRPVDSRAFLQEMIAEGWTVLHLRRRCVADQVLSECLALERGSYHKTDDRREKLQIHIDPKNFLKRYERRMKFAYEDHEALEGLDHLSLIYEDDLMDSTQHQVTASRILAALELPPTPVRTDLRRIGDVDPRNRLRNFDEIFAALDSIGAHWEVNAHQSVNVRHGDNKELNL